MIIWKTAQASAKHPFWYIHEGELKDRMVIFGWTILYLIGLNVISMENVYIKIEWLITLLYHDEIISRVL